MATCFGSCWYSESIPKILDCWSSCNVREKMGAGEMASDSGIVMEYVCEEGIQNLGGRPVSMLMRTGILVKW